MKYIVMKAAEVCKVMKQSRLKDIKDGEMLQIDSNSGEARLLEASGAIERLGRATGKAE